MIDIAAQQIIGFDPLRVHLVWRCPFGERTAGHLEWLFTSAEGQIILATLAAVAVALGGAFVALAAAIAAVALGLDDLLTYARGGESFFGDWIKWLSETAGVSTKTAEMITAAFAIVGAALLAAFNPLLGVPVLFATLTVSAAAFQKEINAAFEKLKADIRGVPEPWRTGAVGSAITNDMARPSLNTSNSVSMGDVVVNQTVSTPTQAPGAAAQATGAAVAGAASRLNLDAAQ